MSLPLNQVIVGDCTEVMRTWPADSIDLVVTSPPYWGLRDYGEETVKIWGGLPECEHEWAEYEADRVTGGTRRPPQSKWKTGPQYDTSRLEGFCSECGAWRGSLGLEPHPQLFIDHLVGICREIKRVLKPTGTFWLNLGDTYASMKGKAYNPGGGVTSLPQDAFKELTRDRNPNRMLKPDGGWLQPKQKLMIPARVAIALQHDGFILRNSICWWKPNAMPSSVKDRLTNAYEHVFMFAKQRRYYFDLDAIRQPHAASTIQRITQPNVMNQLGGDKQRELRGEGGGNASRSADMVKSLARNYEKLTKHDIAVGRIGNFSYTDLLHTKEYNPKGKNPADVWRIPTKPFPAAHFATFPPALIEPIVKAGCPRWICSKCGKSRERITEKTGEFQRRWSTKNKEGSPYNKQDSYQNIYETTGWSDCGCGESFDPGIILDPFCGSGTALRVARRLGRRFIGIDIVPEYVEMARRRIRGDKYREPPAGVTPLDILDKKVMEVNGI